MLKKSAIVEAIFLSLFLFLSCPARAEAYFDLGTGTYMVQVIFAVAAAFWISFRKSIADFCRKPVKPADSHSAPEETLGKTKPEG
jgi:hypothetical protein